MALYGGRLVPEPIDAGIGPAELAEADDLARRTRRAVAALPRGQRAAVMLFYLMNLTHAETAAQLGIEVGAVKARLHKARKRLKQHLADEWKETAMVTRIDFQLVEMRVADVRRQRDEEGQPGKRVVVLEEVGGTRRLLVWVGRFESEAIVLSLLGIQTPRPVTFGFMAALLGALDARLREVRINRLTGEVFYAEAIMEGAGGTKTVDARPSDAINLALVADAPIRVDPAVIEAADAASAVHDTPLLEAMDSAAEIAEEIRARWRA